MNNPEEETVQLTHGAGGRAMGELLEKHVLNTFTRKSAGEIGLDQLDDGATIDLPGEGTLVLTTDSHVVKPLFFPGGDIGKLAVCGTVNDLAVMGADPIALTSSLIVEEGFPIKKLDRVMASMEETSAESGIPIITGDTKVLEKGDMDGLAINTAGIGLADKPISDAGMNPGDKVILTGTIGDHGMALMQYREGLSFKTELKSDIAPLNSLLRSASESGDITAMKDPTRGGIAAALNEMAQKSNLGLTIKEELVSVREAVSGIAELIGISPYEVANEGKAIITARAETAREIVEGLRGHPLGRNARIIGEINQERPGKVIMETEIGGRRFLEAPLGDPVPRIC
ncbi:MAG: hydrogenase expression/formation protein HypE [Candidatus Bipolaricaulota bacterium]|nr:hydrogenase expression/formation protein HypE [Candidatus Bipolaricaulota bacterium]